MDTKIKIGDKFSSYAELLSVIKSYEESNYIKFWIRNSQTLETARKYYPRRVRFARQELIYYQIRFCCIHGGPFQSRSKGFRETRTVRQECPSFMHIKLSKDGYSLEVKSMNDQHNHEISKELFYHYNLPKHLKRKSAKLLRAKKKKVPRHLAFASGSTYEENSLSLTSSEEDHPFYFKAHNLQSKNQKVFNWKPSNVLLLIELYKEHKEEFKSLYKKEKKIWQNIAEEMQFKYNCNVNPLQCEIKMKSVTRLNKKTKDINKHIGNRSKSMVYNEVDELSSDSDISLEPITNSQNVSNSNVEIFPQKCNCYNENEPAWFKKLEEGLERHHNEEMDLLKNFYNFFKSCINK